MSKSEEELSTTPDIVPIGMEAPSHSKQVARAFDAAAEIFDSTFEPSPVIQRIRSRLYGTIEARIPPGSRVLDISCGTGIDAIYLAKRGFTVHGIDISPGMIEQARRKAGIEGLRNVEFHVSSFEDLHRGNTDRFDLVLSNFGGLNCVSNFEKVAGQVAEATKPGAFFIALVMPPFSMWEIASRLARLQWREAFRRVHGSTVATGFRGKTFAVFYHSPRKLSRTFSPWFKVEAIYGLNIFSPPPHATNFTQRHPSLARFLQRFDGLVESLPVLRSMGDHFMIIMMRKPQ